MKIAQIALPWYATPPKNYGGTELATYHLIEEQVAQGLDVTLFATGDARTSAKLEAFFPRSLVEENIPWESHFHAYYHLYRALESARDFDIVHAHLSCLTDLYLLPLASSLQIPLVVTVHSNFPLDRTQSWMKVADILYWRWMRTISVVAVSASARTRFPRELACAGVVHLGVLIDEFPLVERPREDFFFWFGRFVPEKGAHLAIEAAKRANVRIVLGGTVDPYGRVPREYFEDVIKPEIDGDQVSYVGPVNMQQKIDLLSRAQGFLNPIRWEEPFGMVMIEAMAMGCPVIAFARGAAPELIAHEKTGFLAHTLEEMISFIPRIDEIDRGATRMHVAQHFSARRTAEQYTRIYKELIAAYGKRPASSTV